MKQMKSHGMAKIGGSLKAKQVYPVKKIDPATVGFLLDKNQAIKVGTALLAMADDSETGDIIMTGYRENNKITINGYLRKGEKK